MLVVIALFFLGGEVLHTFALTLIIGIIVGTYSSIYVAAPIVVIWKEWQEPRQARRRAGRGGSAGRRAPPSAAQPPAPLRRKPESEEAEGERSGALRPRLLPRPRLPPVLLRPA